MALVREYLTELTLALAFADGLWVKEPPAQSGDVRLILSGKFLDSAKQLKGEWRFSHQHHIEGGLGGGH